MQYWFRTRRSSGCSMPSTHALSQWSSLAASPPRHRALAATRNGPEARGEMSPTARSWPGDNRFGGKGTVPSASLRSTTAHLLLCSRRSSERALLWCVIRYWPAVVAPLESRPLFGVLCGIRTARPYDSHVGRTTRPAPATTISARRSAETSGAIGRTRRRLRRLSPSAGFRHRGYFVRGRRILARTGRRSPIDPRVASSPTAT